MITVHLNKSKGAQPIYLQLYEAIRDLILRNSLSAGQPLPSKRALATHLNVSLKTVEAAYQQLQMEGYIHAKQRVGYFVSPLHGFRIKRTKPLPYTSKYAEQTWRLDVKANKNPHEVLPQSVWMRLGREAFSDHADVLFETVPFNGVTELRVAISHYLRSFRGMHASPEQIIIGSGTEFLYQRLHQLLRLNTANTQKNIVGLDDPGYGHITTILTNMGIEHRAIMADEHGMNPKTLEESGCNIINISPAYSFPMGEIMPVSRRAELLQWADRAPNRYIIEDDYNSEYLYRGNPMPPLFETDINQKVIYMNTFSKTVAPSIRIAYMVLPESLMDVYLSSLSFYSCTVASMPQYHLARFVSEGHLERLIRRTCQINVSTQRMLLHMIEEPKYKGLFNSSFSHAGTHMLLDLATEKNDDEVLAELKENGILASFVSGYCTMPRPDLEHKLIVNYSRLTEDDAELLLDTLMQVI